MDMKGESRVTFPSENNREKEIKESRINFDSGTENIIQEPSESAKKPIRNVNITCKYDRKQMRVRLEVEEWMYDQLQELYDCKEGHDAPIEIDIDDILGIDDEHKRPILKDLLKGASQPVDGFITELLEKLQAMKQMPSRPTRVSMEMDL